jgi:hypothetical protein
VSGDPGRVSTAAKTLLYSLFWRNAPSRAANAENAPPLQLKYPLAPIRHENLKSLKTVDLILLKNVF